MLAFDDSLIKMDRYLDGELEMAYSNSVMNRYKWFSCDTRAGGQLIGMFFPLQRIPEPVSDLGLRRARVSHRLSSLELAILLAQVEVGHTSEPDGDDGGGQVDRESDQVSGGRLVEVGLRFQKGARSVIMPTRLCSRYARYANDSQSRRWACC